MFDLWQNYSFFRLLLQVKIYASDANLAGCADAGRRKNGARSRVSELMPIREK